MTGDRITILHFSNSLVRGGAEQYILTLLRGLDGQRFRQCLVCTPPVAERMRPDVPPGVELIALELRRPRQWRQALRLSRILRGRRVDILHSHLFYASLFASPLGKLCRVPVILETPHLREHWRTGWKSHYWVDRAVGRCLDGYIAVSQANGRYLTNVKGLPPRKVTVIQNGSDLQRFNPAHVSPPGMRSALGIGEDDPVLVVAARLDHQKGHGVLLEAMPAVRAEFPGVRLVCVGDGSLRSELEARSRALQLEETVRFVGYQSNMADWLALGDATVLPSFYEGLPLIAIESLAAGRPVVATAVDGTPEVVVDGKTGLTVPPGDPARLSEAIRQMLRDAGMRRQMALDGRQWVLERFSQERQVRETGELYIRFWQERTARTAPVPVRAACGR